MFSELSCGQSRVLRQEFLYKSCSRCVDERVDVHVGEKDGVAVWGFVRHGRPQRRFMTLVNERGEGVEGLESVGKLLMMVVGLRF